MFIKSFGRGGGRKSFLLLLPLLLLFLLLLLLLLLFSVTWHGSRNQEFINSCGDIHNISFPFQLLGDPSNTCNDTYYTLICDENNRTLLNLFFGTYVVQSINYTDYSISLLFNQLNQPINQTNFGLLCFSEGESPIALTVDFDPVNAAGGPYTLPALTLVATLGCENPVHTPIYLNKTGYCQQNFGNGNYSYVVAGDQLRARDIADSCSVEALYLSSSQLIRERGSNMSLSDMNRELGSGVEVSWESVRACETCRKRAFCFGSAVNVISVCGDACKFVPYFQIGKIF
ncbi:hypothetical protein Vadar_026293 [Vaccinium darrowii]|uniref:Uncharacterized protein n=1 Tax=Vaccinium darrowii TaxID=229202 RepID=A0ACB7YPW9_9ERIC|nr:hypothetical protein Vadar_026293 [Vaccinium darrowii]